jgi:serine/threonine protein kinase
MTTDASYFVERFPFKKSKFVSFQSIISVLSCVPFLTCGLYIIICSLDHANIVSLYDYWEEETMHSLALEFAALGDLQNFRQHNRFPRTQMVLYIRQITFALEHLASRGIAHRDLKGENILVFDEDTVKLADFGWAIQLLDENYNRGTLCGTPEFVPPEMIKGTYDARHVDQWGLGILTWELLEHRGLFDITSATKQEMMEELGLETPNDTTFALIKNFQQLDVTKTTDSHFADFCTKLIVYDPLRRMSFTQALSHPFLGGCSQESSGEHLPDRNIKRPRFAIK